MSGSIFKRRRTSSAMSANRPFRDDESLTTEGGGFNGSSAAAPNRPSRSGRTPSGAGLSSSYGLPTRSYIHHAGHGTSGTVQYSSSLGVRQETAELSSSFLESDSDMSRYFSPESRHDSNGRRHEPIEERSEPVTPEGKSPPAPRSSELTAALQHHSPSGFLDPYEVDSESSASGTTARPHPPEVVVTGDESEDEDDEATERSALLPRARLPSYRKQTYDAAPQTEEQPVGKAGTWNRLGHHYPSVHALALRVRHVALNPKTWDMRAVGRTVILRPASMLPAVFLGLLLNLLDALSYGIIL